MAVHLTTLARGSIDSIGSNRSMGGGNQFGLSKEEFRERYWNAQDLENSIDVGSQKVSFRERSPHVKENDSPDSIKAGEKIVGGLRAGVTLKSNIGI
jgi:hypothetical protein